jgi:hypothetical protein
MKTMASLEPAAALRHLCAEPAAEFGARLLARAEGSAVPFRTFVQVARDMVRGQPHGTATWLAALVALEMCRAAGSHEDPPAAASPN